MPAPARARRPPRSSSRSRCSGRAGASRPSPSTGPSAAGAPLRAYTRVSDRPIRRHDSIEHPDLVVVLEPSLVGEASIDEGLPDEGLVLVDAEEVPAGLAGRHVRCVPASRLAAERGSSFGNLVMVGAVAAALGEPPLKRFRRPRSSCSAESWQPTICAVPSRRATDGSPEDLGTSSRSVARLSPTRRSALSPEAGARASSLRSTPRSA